MLAVAMVFGLALVGCKNDVEDEVEDDPLNGTYSEGNVSLVLNNGNWTAKENGNEMQRGTYTISGNNITLTSTDWYFNSEMASQLNTTVGWKNRSQTTELLRNAGFTDARINETMAPITGTISGNTITVFGNTLTRQ
jgi:hypothetical protein